MAKRRIKTKQPICPYYDKLHRSCSHPRCERMVGQECKAKHYFRGKVYYL